MPIVITLHCYHCAHEPDKSPAPGLPLGSSRANNKFFASIYVSSSVTMLGNPHTPNRKLNALTLKKSLASFF